MLVKLLGFSRFDGEYEGRTYHQTKLYCELLDEKKDNLVGSMVCEVTVKDELNPPTFAVGNYYRVYYGRPKAYDGKAVAQIEMIVAVDEKDAKKAIDELNQPVF